MADRRLEVAKVRFINICIKKKDKIMKLIKVCERYFMRF